MGYPIVGHLSRGGHEVVVYNRTTSEVGAWLTEFEGSASATPQLAASKDEVVFGCVGNDDDLRAVTLGSNGAFAGMAAGSIYVDHSTTSAQVATELAARGGELGIEFLDAPVSGGQSDAQNGQLTVMCGGGQETFERV